MSEKLQESARFKCILLKSFSDQFLIPKLFKTLDFCHAEAWSFMQDEALKNIVEKHFNLYSEFVFSPLYLQICQSTTFPASIDSNIHK